jgi:hypothetical protein
MPPALLKAHQTLDKAIDKLYRASAFIGDRDRVEYLFRLYESLTAPLIRSGKKKKASR